jgi:hypothetical protein
MFYDIQDEISKKEYEKALTIIGNLSNLFSESNIPYLYYRIAEKVFCGAFNASDLSRGDIALDAAKDGLGIGLKTFLAKNNRTFQKIAEFNKNRDLYIDGSNEEIIRAVSTLRNERVKFAEKLSGVSKSLYHCITRDENRFFIFEEAMDLIDIDSIRDIRKKKNSIFFSDNRHQYNFNLSKSTLLKRFDTGECIHNFDVEIFDNPLKKLQECFSHIPNETQSQNHIMDSVCLPLYGKDKIVPKRSGLNQWNAQGRIRNPNEVYIPIPAKVHECSPSFFPSRDIPFFLHLPNGDKLNAKVCQDNNKALMSNPNKDLGKWLLRDVLDLAEGELLTYEKLLQIGVDTVKIDKIDGENYLINFIALDSYEEYLSQCDNQ